MSPFFSVIISLTFGTQFTCKIFLSIYIYIALSMRLSVIFMIGLLMFYGTYNGLLV